MSYLEIMLDLKKRGFSVFPLVEKGKTPLNKGWQKDAMAGAGDVVYSLPNSNVGIYTHNLLVVDVDNKKGKNGDEEILRLELAGYEFPPTFTQKTPTGGRHLVYRVSHPVSSSAGKLGPGLDIRGAGGYIVGAGSVLPAGKYEIIDGRAPVAAPQWLVESCGAPREKTEIENKIIEGLDEETAVKRAIHYLEKEAPLAIEGQSGDQTTYQVAARVKDFGVTLNHAIHLMLDHWNQRCMPPWHESEIVFKVENAYRYGKDPIGIAAPEADFEPIPLEKKVEAAPEPEVHYLEKLNKEYALIYVEGSHFVLNETVDEKGRPKRVFLNEASFKRRFSPYTVQKTAKGKGLTFAEEWLDWKGRREFQGICFTPGKEPKFGYYNLWRGFSTEPRSFEKSSKAAQSGFNMFMNHALLNVCNNNQELLAWHMGYYAHLIQRPYERPLTTLVYRGRKGVGKNALVDRVGKLLGSGHYLVAHDGRYLTSNFNGHLDSCLCLVLDEAFWSGDKNAEGKLKGLTTAPEILIERKGKEPYTVDNFVRLIVIGNEDWLVPASHDERRYAVFQVGEGRKQDNDFFHQMRLNMDERGGNSILLHYLQNFDLSKVDVNKAPATEALYEQKVASLEVFYEWWAECLHAGYITRQEFGTGVWPTIIDKEQIRNAFRRYCKERNISGRVLEDGAIGRKLRQCLPSAEFKAKRRDGDKTFHAYKFPPLADSRRDWERFINYPVQWD